MRRSIVGLALALILLTGCEGGDDDDVIFGAGFAGVGPGVACAAVCLVATMVAYRLRRA